MKECMPTTRLVQSVAHNDVIRAKYSKIGYSDLRLDIRTGKVEVDGDGCKLLLWCYE